MEHHRPAGLTSVLSGATPPLARARMTPTPWDDSRQRCAGAVVTWCEVHWRAPRRERRFVLLLLSLAPAWM